MKYFNNDTEASDPLSIRLSHEKLKKLAPDLYGSKGFEINCKIGVDFKKVIEEHIFYGDSQPAIVICLQPLLIAAYSDELDCIAMLKFPWNYIMEYGLKEKTKLITSNTYSSKPEYQTDLIIGDKNLGNWFGFHPIIAEFVSEDIQKIEIRKQQIDDEQWEYVYNLGKNYFNKYQGVYRDGNPMLSGIPTFRIPK
jgi:hypothetical protein